MPLTDGAEIGAAAKEVLSQAMVVVGESRKVAFPYLKQAPEPAGREVFLLDPPRNDERELLFERLQVAKARGETVALFSDTGMPMLFDPGEEVYRHCRELGFRIRSVPAATSWGTAAALSGYSPPFHVVGFLPRDEAEREALLHRLKEDSSALVLLETPYRMSLLLKQLARWAPHREGFLAWEIGKPEERYLWASLAKLPAVAESQGLVKGEFIVIVSAERKGKRGR